MGKLVFWLAVLGAVFLGVRALRLIQRRDASRQVEEDKPQSMARCAHCGVRFPASDAVRDGDLVFCSPAHRSAPT